MRNGRDPHHSQNGFGALLVPETLALPKSQTRKPLVRNWRPGDKRARTEIFCCMENRIIETDSIPQIFSGSSILLRSSPSKCTDPVKKNSEIDRSDSDCLGLMPAE